MLNGKKKTVNITADAAIAAATGSKRDEAQSEIRKWLAKRLAASEPVLATVIFEEGEELGFSEKQIKTAARRLNVVKDKSGFDGPWTWHLPL